MSIINLKRSRSESPARMPEDKPTLEAVFEAEESPLLRFAYSIVRRRAVAEEMVQEAFMRLHRHWEEVEKPRPWIYRAVRNLCLTHLRDNARETNLDDDKNDESGAERCPAETLKPDETLGRMEAVGTVKLLLAEMDETDRQLVQLKYVEGQSYAAIGKATGLSVSNVGYRLHHLLKGLAASLRQAGIAGSQG